MKKYIPLIALLLSSTSMSAAPQDPPLILGDATPEDRARITDTVGTILRIASDPGSAALLLTPDLKRTECFPLAKGLRRCMYWNPLLGDDNPLPIASLDLISKHHLGDHGANAFWETRSNVCLDPLLFTSLGIAKVEKYSNPPEPFSNTDIADSTVQSYVKHAPQWGDTVIKIRIINGCATNIQLHALKKT